MGILSLFVFIFFSCCFILGWNFFSGNQRRQIHFPYREEIYSYLKDRINDTTFGIISTRYKTFFLFWHRIFLTQVPSKCTFSIHHVLTNDTSCSKWKTYFLRYIGNECLWDLVPWIRRCRFQWQLVNTDPFRREMVVKKIIAFFGNGVICL